MHAVTLLSDAAKGLGAEWGQSRSSCCTSSAILTADDSRVQQRDGRLTLSAKLRPATLGQIMEIGCKLTL